MYSLKSLSVPAPCGLPHWSFNFELKSNLPFRPVTSVARRRLAVTFRWGFATWTCRDDRRPPMHQCQVVRLPRCTGPQMICLKGVELLTGYARCCQRLNAWVCIAALGAIHLGAYSRTLPTVSPEHNFLSDLAHPRPQSPIDRNQRFDH